MVEYVSNSSRVSFAREGTYNVAPAAYGGTGGSSSPRMVGILQQTLDFPDKELDVKQYRNFGSGRRFFDNKPGKRTRAGTLAFLPTTPEMLLYAFAGRADQSTPFEGYSITSLGGAPTVYQHVLRPANVSKLASFAVAVDLPGNPNFQRVFTGCQIDGLSIKLQETGELEFDLDYRAKDVVNEQLASPTPFTQPLDDAYSSPYSTTAMPYMFYDRAANISYGGTYDYTTNSYTGSRTLARVKSFADFDLTLEIVPAGHAAADTDAIYDLLESEAKFDVVIPFTRPAGDTLNFIFDNCRIKSAPHSLPEDGGEVNVSVSLTVDEMRVVATDRVADYKVL